MEFFKDIVITILGAMLMALGIVIFLLPNQLSSGGFNGVATVFYYLFGAKVGLVTFLLNIPLFAIAFFKLGKKFFIQALIGTCFLSLFLDFLEINFANFTSITEDKLLASIYGGLVIGVGNAIVLRSNGSTGGTELLSVLITKINPTIKTGTMLVILDTIIVGINMLFLGQIEIGLYSAIAIYIVGKIIEVIAEGINFTKMIFIVSDKYEEISKAISKRLRRGSTAIYAKGMYERKEKKILWCVASRNEIVKIKNIASSIDENSFMTIFNAREAYGEGFSIPKQKITNKIFKKNIDTYSNE